jgi:two-component system response regulator YesN
MKKPEFSSISLELLTRSILEGQETQLDKFFDDAYQSFLEAELITPEIFRGFCIEVLSTLIHILKMNDLDERALFSDYESMYKNIFNQRTPTKTLEWLNRLSKQVIQIIMLERQSESRSERIVRYINRNCSEQLSLKVLACHFKLSPSHLGRLFHQAVGKSFTNYLNELRLRKAEDLLKYSALSASQVAKRIGYTNVNYFYTLFKKYRGCFPSQLRKFQDQEPLEKPRRNSAPSLGRKQ